MSQENNKPLHPALRIANEKLTIAQIEAAVYEYWTDLDEDEPTYNGIMNAIRGCINSQPTPK